MGLFFAKKEYVPRYDSITSLKDYPLLYGCEQWIYDEDKIREKVATCKERNGKPFAEFFDISPDHLIELVRKHKAEQQAAQEQKLAQQAQKTAPKSTTLDPGDVEIAPGVILTAEQFKNMQDVLRDTYAQSNKQQTSNTAKQPVQENKAAPSENAKNPSLDIHGNPALMKNADFNALAQQMLKLTLEQHETAEKIKALKQEIKDKFNAEIAVRDNTLSEITKF